MLKLVQALVLGRAFLQAQVIEETQGENKMPALQFAMLDVKSKRSKFRLLLFSQGMQAMKAEQGVSAAEFIKNNRNDIMINPYIKTDAETGDTYTVWQLKHNSEASTFKNAVSAFGLTDEELALMGEELDGIDAGIAVATTESLWKDFIASFEFYAPETVAKVDDDKINSAVPQAATQQ